MKNKSSFELSKAMSSGLETQMSVSELYKMAKEKKALYFTIGSRVVEFTKSKNNKINIVSVYEASGELLQTRKITFPKGLTSYNRHSTIRAALLSLTTVHIRDEGVQQSRAIASTDLLRRAQPSIHADKASLSALASALITFNEITRFQ